MLVHNWREVLKRAWSVRLVAPALLIIILEAVYISLPRLGFLTTSISNS